LLKPSLSDHDLVTANASQPTLDSLLPDLDHEMVAEVARILGDGLSARPSGVELAVDVDPLDSR